MLTAALKHPQKIASFAHKMQVARRLYDKPYGDLLRRFYYLCRKEHYSPREVFIWDLLGPKFAADELDTAMSKSACIAIQRRLNPPSAEVLTEDKGVFYRYCRARGLASPRLFAVMGPRLGWTAEGGVLSGDGDWVRFFADLDAPQIVIKPTLGVYARGVRLLQREGADWIGSSGARLSAEVLVAALRRDPDYGSFLVQERIHCHPRLAALGGTDFLQTVRIITVVSPERGSEIIFAFLKVIAGAAITDNFSYGASGNLLAPIDLATGRLNSVQAAGSAGVGLQAVLQHPVTGASFEGFEVPLWTEACDLARQAALDFLPLVTIGWDVALTPNGPLLIEGNAWWDPILTIEKRMRVFRGYAKDMGAI